MQTVTKESWRVYASIAQNTFRQKFTRNQEGHKQRRAFCNDKWVDPSRR